MQKQIVKKAKELIKSRKVFVEDVKGDRIYMAVKSHQKHSIIIFNDNSFGCTCTFGSLSLDKGGQTRLCSHALAAFAVLVSGVGEKCC